MSADHGHGGGLGPALAILSRDPVTAPTLRAFTGLHEVALADGSLDRRTKEIIAVGIAIARQCFECVEWHVRAAVQAGATADEVAEAAAVAIMMGGGPAIGGAGAAVSLAHSLADSVSATASA